jgi:hypothetical protein
MADNDVEVQFGASTSDLDAATAEAKSRIADFAEAAEDAVAEHFDGIQDILKEFAGAVGLAFGADAFVEWIKSSAELGEELENVSAELGITLQQASELRGMAELTGTSFSGLQTEFERLQLSLTELDNANSKTSQSLRVLGINAQEFAKASITQQVEQLAEAFSRFADGPTKTAAAMALLGRNGAEMLPFLDRGKAGFDELNEELERTGAVMSGEMVEAFAKTEDQIHELSQASQGLSNLIFNALNPAIQGVLQETINLAETFTNASEQSAAAQRQLSLLGDAGKVLSTIFIGVEAAVKLAFSEMVAYAEQAEDAIVGMGRMIRDAFSGNFSAIAGDAKKAWGQMGSDSDAVADQEVKTFTQAFDTIKNMWAQTAEGSGQKPNLPKVPKLQLGGSQDDALEAAQKEADGEVQAYAAAEKQKQALLEEEVKTRQISAQQGLVAIQDALQDEWQDTQDTYQRELSLDNLKASQRQDILNKMQEADAKYNAALQQLDLKASEETVKEWQDAFKEINSAFDSQISGLLKGTTSWATALRSVLSELTTDVVKFFVNWGLQATENEAMQILGIGRVTAAQEAGSAAQASAQSAGSAAGAAASASSILGALVNDAKATFGGVFAFLAPVLGPAAAGPAAAAGATVLAGSSFAIGSWDIPQDMPAMVHKGEMIVPARATPWAQDLMANAAGGTSNRAGGDVHNHSWNVSVNGARKPEDVVDEIQDNVRAISKIISRQIHR